jgi:WD40 repeat protein/DNA-binding SARP family transcriptional activator/energy-coupling factor transporter ATP-binding protein EcfA2
VSHLALYLFGPPQLRRGAQLLKIDARKNIALLAFLAVTGSSQSRETLCTLLWPDLEPRRAQNVLRRNLSTLNKTLKGQWLVVEQDIIRLDNETDIWCDVVDFRRLVYKNQDHNHEQTTICDACLKDLAEAAALYHDNFMAGFGVRSSPNFDDWQLIETEKLSRELSYVLERLVIGYRERQEFDQAINYAQRWLAFDPLNEPAHRQLMLLYAEKGDRSAALGQYQICMRTLEKEIGVAPDSETTALYESLRQDGKAYRKVWPEISITTPEPPPPSPYRGLFSFQEQDAPYFFGRESFTRNLYGVVQKQPLVAVVGPSGSGKSSVVLAGLLPQIREQAKWLIVTFRPGSDPFLGIASALLPHLELDLSETDTLLETRKLAKALQTGEILLEEVITRVLDKSGEATRLLIVTDQFEELYTLCPEPEERDNFLGVILAATEVQRFRHAPTFSFVFTLRADFLEQALSFRPLADAIQDANLLLGPMFPEELRQSIEKPAEKMDVSFEPGLVERILDDVGQKPGNLPLLEFALAMLWEEQQYRVLTHHGYDAIGRVEGALTRHADQVFNSLDPNQQEAARRIFIQLVRPGEGTEDTRRIAQRGELSDFDWSLVQQLADARLVVTDRDALGGEIVEIVHEALIINWSRFQQWMKEDRTFRAWQERVRSSMRQWQTTRQNEGALLRGVPLAEAEGWLAEKKGDLSEAECAYIQASIDLHEQRNLERERNRLARERLRLRITQGLVAGLVLALILIALAGWQWQRAERQRIFALEAQNRIASERDQAQMALSRQLATQAFTLQEDQLDLGLLLSVEAERIADTTEARGSLRAGLTSNPRLKTYFHDFNDRVTSVAYSPDGQTVASGSNDNRILLWDVATGRTRGKPLSGHEDNVLHLDFSLDGKILASASADKTIQLWDVTSGLPLFNKPLRGHSEAVNSVAFSPDGKTLASSGGKTIILWDLTSRSGMSSTLTAHTAPVRTVAFSPDGRTLASGSDDQTIILWDTGSGEPVAPPLTGHNALVRSVAFSPDGRSLASASEDGRVIIWDLTAEPTLEKTLTGHSGSVRSIAFNPNPSNNPNGDVLASAGTDESIILWDVSNGRPLESPLRGHTDWIRSIAFSPDGRFLASASHDQSVILWDVAGQAIDPALLRPPLVEHLGSVRSVAFSPDGQLIASGGDDGSILVWDAATGDLKGPPLTGHAEGVRSVAFSPDGKILASGSDDKAIRLWDIATGKDIGPPLIAHEEGVRSVAFSPDGKTLASGSKDESIILWDLQTAEPFGPPLPGHSNGVQSVAFSPDGRFLASAGEDAIIKLWDISVNPLLSATLTGHEDVVFGVAFSPDGRTLASSSWDKTLRLWDVESGQPIGLPLTGHLEGVQAVVFKPDGRTLASGSWDETINLWDVTSGLSFTFMSPLAGHMGSVRTLAIGPDGQMMASAGDDGTIMLWDVDLDSWQTLACRRANRNLTQAEWQRFFGDQDFQVTCPELAER